MKAHRLGWSVPAAALMIACTAAFVLVACDNNGSPVPPTQSTLPQAWHVNVALLDRHGSQLTASSTEPYSPRKTCGQCHLVNVIANGYHFQQGRTNTAGDIQTKADFFGDGRDYIRSPGMYGKW